ncbi:CGNR zinc finger domain-containing protein [Ferdinandcohnia quinoae]|uniref:CGNR zinc finger domain-containing protein n=1 Tax=Fredinandcohnia quinoae TaxID=2918902 RepID=A0AAW5E7E3_9BACI|nr:CGNR zinc finger domain-containing protein [Fredinandcohnia sp. SECRCQ15]MCH1625316.1 CGNR zinc finger domain-containing protein [Fredinandcohnia sp. SECRCQ15]
MSETNKYMMVGERLCLDFINTISWRESEDKRRDWFTSYDKLVDWSLHAGIVEEKQAHLLLKKSVLNPSESEQTLRQAIQLREAIYRIFCSFTKKELINPEDLTNFNKVMRHYYQLMQLVPMENDYSLQFDISEGAFDSMLPPIVQSAVDILTSEQDLGRVKHCEGDPCGWLFFDTSRNRSRRWCSMADCGNRAKARRFYQNKK